MNNIVIDIDKSDKKSDVIIKRKSIVIKEFKTKSKDMIQVNDKKDCEFFPTISSLVNSFYNNDAQFDNGRVVYVTHSSLDSSKNSNDLNEHLSNHSSKTTKLHDASNFKLTDFYSNKQLSRAFVKSFKKLKQEIPDDYSLGFKYKKYKNLLFGSSGLIVIMNIIFQFIGNITDIISYINQLMTYIIILIPFMLGFVFLVLGFVVNKKHKIKEKPNYDLIIKLKKFRDIKNFNTTFSTYLNESKIIKLFKAADVHIITNIDNNAIIRDILINSITKYAPDNKFTIIFREKSYINNIIESLEIQSSFADVITQRDNFAIFEIIDINYEDKIDYLGEVLKNLKIINENINTSIYHASYSALLRHFGVDILFNLMNQHTHTYTSKEKETLQESFDKKPLEKNIVYFLSFFSTTFQTSKDVFYSLQNDYISNKKTSNPTFLLDKQISGYLNFKNFKNNRKKKSQSPSIEIKGILSDIPIIDLVEIKNHYSYKFNKKLVDIMNDIVDDDIVKIKIKLLSLIRFINNAPAINCIIGNYGNNNPINIDIDYSDQELALLFNLYQELFIDLFKSELDFYTEFNITPEQLSIIVSSVLSFFESQENYYFHFGIFLTLTELLNGLEKNKKPNPFIEFIVYDNKINESLVKAFTLFPSIDAWNAHLSFINLKAEQLNIDVSFSISDDIKNEIIVIPDMADTNYIEVLYMLKKCPNNISSNFDEMMWNLLTELFKICEYSLLQIAKDSILLSSNTSSLQKDNFINDLKNNPVAQNDKGYLGKLNNIIYNNEDYIKLCDELDMYLIYYFTAACNYYLKNDINKGDFARFIRDLISMEFDKTLKCRLFANWIKKPSLQKNIMSDYINSNVNHFIEVINYCFTTKKMNNLEFQEVVVDLCLINQYLNGENSDLLFSQCYPHLSNNYQIELFDFMFSKSKPTEDILSLQNKNYCPDIMVLIMSRYEDENQVISSVPLLFDEIISKSNINTVYRWCGNYLLKENRYNDINSEILLFYLNHIIYRRDLNEEECELAASVIDLYYSYNNIQRKEYLSTVGKQWMNIKIEKLKTSLHEIRAEYDAQKISYNEYKEKEEKLREAIKALLNLNPITFVNMLLRKIVK